MASKLTSADVPVPGYQSDVISKTVRDATTNIKNKTNELIDEIAAAAIGTTNAETTAARPYNTNLKERLDQINDKQYIISSGGIVSINGGDAQKVDVTEVIGTINGIENKIAAVTSATVAFTGSNTRYDVVVGNTDNTFTVVTGTPAATPVLPDIASTQRALWVLLIGTASVALAWDARDQGCWYNNSGHLSYEWKIQDAIDALSNGGDIFVGRGTYLETLSYDDNQTIEFEGGVTLKTAGGVAVELQEIDIKDKTDSKILWSGGALGNGGIINGFRATGSQTAIATIGTPAIAALSNVRIAFIDDTNDDLRTYDFDGTDWAQVGNDLNIVDVLRPSMTALSATRIAFIDDTNADLRTYDFDGTDWVQVGNDLNIAGVGSSSMAALSGVRIAFIDDGNDDLRTYDFDGTDWIQVGNDLNIVNVGPPAITALSSSRVAFIDDEQDELRAYDFDGTDWTQTGNGLKVGAGSGFTITAITSTRVVFTSSNDVITTFEFDGTNWVKISSDFAIASVTAPSITSLTKSRVCFIDSETDKLNVFDVVNLPAFIDNASTTVPAPPF